MVVAMTDRRRPT